MNKVTSINKSPFYQMADDGSFYNVSLDQFFTMAEPPNRPIVQTLIKRDDKDDVIISTIFTGCDASCSDEPVLFETMIFGGNMSGSVWRYTSMIAAEKGHADVVDAILSYLSIPHDSEVVTHEYFHKGQRLH